MEKIKYYIEKYKIQILITIISIILVSLLIIILNTNSKKTTKIEKVNNVESVVLDAQKEYEETKKEKKEKFKVDIKGMVKKPGVYELEENSRVIDVINIAGGLKEGANTEYINLSKKIKDEMIIIIYSNDDVEKFKQTDENIIYIKYECECPDNINGACITENDTVNTNGIKNNKTNKDNKTELENKDNEDNNKENNIVSINTGTLEELMTLTGIGESKAKAIITYREENNGFKELEELMNISGIGEKAYSKIKDNIKL